MLIKSLLWVAVGAAGALESERLLSKARVRFSPSAVTGSFLDKVNTKLESKRESDIPAPGL
jgi:hypothetical protein